MVIPRSIGKTAMVILAGRYSFVQTGCQVNEGVEKHIELYLTKEY